MKRLISFVCTGGVAVFLLSTFSSHAVPGDEHWDPQFNWPGTTNAIYGIAVSDGRIYAGGQITAGTLTNAPLEVWDGFQWSTMGAFAGSPVIIYDVAAVGSTLYVAGIFTSVNGAAAAGLAKWDGTGWNGIGFSGIAYALAVDGNNLYVAGAYTNADAGGVVMTNIGYWDGSAWHALGGGLGTPGNGTTRTVIVNNGLVYAGGYFTNSGSLLITNLAVWNGSSWSAVGGGVNSSVYSLAFNGTDFYVGGSFTQAGSTPATNIARWDGANWSAVGGGLTGAAGSLVESLAVFNGSVCAAGSFTNAGGLKVANFAVWNGASWSAANGGLGAAGYRVVNNGTNVYVGGNFQTASGRLMGYIAAFDGVNWSPIGTAGQINGISATARALAGDGTNLYAGGGSLSLMGQTNANLIARFDGTNWFPLSTGISGSGVVSGPIGTTILTLNVTNNYVYAGGYFTNAGGVPVTNIAVWNGTNWSALGNPGGVVASMLIRTDGVYAAGAPFYNASYYNSPFFNRWDGANWNGVAINFPPMTDWEISIGPFIGMDALACIGTNIFIGGYFFLGEYTNTPPLGFVGCNNIMRFDGTYGWVMGTGLSSNVTTMAVINTNLYVAGLFTNAGGVTASKIAQWNGSYWTNLGSGLVGSGVINALATMGGNLYAAGTFTNMGGTSANRIAKWDGANWTALGNGATYPGLDTASSIVGLGVSGNNLFASGTFRMAGDRASFNLARWNEQTNFDTPQISPLPVTGNLFRLRLFGIEGLTNLIQATTNFTTWTPVLTNSAGIYDFTDSNAAHFPYRFYRAALSP
jgi:trimeric autotransporter adhesin